MRRIEKGFTLIELVIVMVILGILAAVAVPRFESFTSQAQAAAIAGGKSAVASALAIQTAQTKGSPSGTSVASQLPGSTCAGTGIVEIPGTGGSVKITLQDSAASAIATCASLAFSVGAGTFSAA